MASIEKYRALVDRLETQAQQTPGRYKLKLGLVAGLGFLVLGGSVLAALGLSLGLLLTMVVLNPLLLLKLIKVIWIPVAFGGTVLNALWVPFRLPGGYRLRKGEAPELQAEIERVRQAAQAPPLSGIMIDNALNAAAASIPRRLGLFGHRHYLVLGLPLMQLLDRSQLMWVIAHEFGHFGGRHGQFNGWIYRVRSSWHRLLTELNARRSPVAGIFAGFFRWYAPYFDAYSFALARRNEFDADATAARIAGTQVAGQALVQVQLGSQRLERDFWPALQQSARTVPLPPTALFRDMAASLRTPAAEDEARLQALLQAPAGIEDTHPSLAQRLAALGVPARTVPPAPESAAESLLGDLLPRLEAQFSDEWRGQFGRQWQERHREHALAQSRLHALEAQSERTALEALEHAHLVEVVRSGDEALPLYRAAVAQLPEHAYGQFRLGALLLERDDEAGLMHLRRAIDLEFNAIEPVLNLVLTYLARTEASEARARQIITDLQTLYLQRARAVQARETLTTRDRFLAHDLDAATLDAVKRVAEGIPGLSQVWIARKLIADDPADATQLVVLAKWKRKAVPQNSRFQEALLALQRLGHFTVFSANGGGRIAARGVKAVGAPVYRSGWW